MRDVSGRPHGLTVPLEVVDPVTLSPVADPILCTDLQGLRFGVDVVTVLVSPGRWRLEGPVTRKFPTRYFRGTLTPGVVKL